MITTISQVENANLFNINRENIKLTNHEELILLLLLKQYSTKEIAEELMVDSSYVKSHIDNLIRKTGSKNIVGLIVFAFNNQ